MIWSQDGDPPYPRRRRDRQGEWRSGLPTCRDLWFATAHEQADTVVQILSGNGITYGLGAVYTDVDRYHDFPERRADLDQQRVRLTTRERDVVTDTQGLIARQLSGAVVGDAVSTRLHPQAIRRRATVVRKARARRDVMNSTRADLESPSDRGGETAGKPLVNGRRFR